MCAARAYTGKASVRAVVERVTSENGMPQIAPAFARRGDVALIRRPRDWSVGVVGLNGREVLALAQAGLSPVPAAAAISFWRV